MKSLKFFSGMGIIKDEALKCDQEVEMNNLKK